MFDVALSIISLFHIAVDGIVLFNKTLCNFVMDDIVLGSVKLFLIL